MSEDFIQCVDLKRWPVAEGVWFLIYAVVIVVVVSILAWKKQRRSR